jgi:hypothetical protein
MKLIALTFEQEDEGAVPSRITVEMSLAETAAIAHIFGAMNHHALSRLGVADDTWESGIYGCLVDDVLNRYWDDGIDHFGLPPVLAELNAPLGGPS